MLHSFKDIFAMDNLYRIKFTDVSKYSTGPTSLAIFYPAVVLDIVIHYIKI